MRFAVFTHVIHQEKKGRYYAYSPYVREMNLWFKYVEEVEVISPRVSEGGESLFGKAYQHNNIIFKSLPAFDLLSLSAVLNSVVKVPIIFIKILGAMRRADHLHLRCPGNIGLLAAIAQIFFRKKPKTVKYAGNWDPKAKQPWTYILQKKILSNTFLSRNIKVLVYGDWPNQSANIFPFFTTSFSEEEKGPIRKDFKSPYKFIFTGNLVKGKGIFEAIELIEVLNSKGVDSELEIYGDGILKDNLNESIQKKDLQKFVKLRGRKSLEELKEAYKKAHFVILLSKSEGWPKTIAEGMWYGCVPVATPVSCVPWMLNAPSAPKGGASVITLANRGILLNNIFLYRLRKNCLFSIHPDGRHISRTGFSEPIEGMSSEKADLAGLVRLFGNPGKLEEMSRAAQLWSQEYTLERFERAIREIV